MTIPFRKRPDPRLERDLSALGHRITIPEAPDLTAVVTERLRGEVRAGVGHRPFWLRPLAIGLSAAGVAVAVLVLSPGTRSAVADFLGVDGIHIGFGPRSDAPVARDLALGDAVQSLDEAESRLGFDLVVPSRLGAPDEVYVSSSPPGVRQATLVYRARDGLPAARETGVGVLFSQLSGALDETFYKKLVAGSTTLEVVDLNGGRAYWIAGEAHELSLIDRYGRVSKVRPRLAGNTLVWEARGISYRMESALSREAALDIARSAS